MTRLQAPETSVNTAEGFETEVASVLQQLRRSVTAVLAAVPELDSSSSATDVQRALNINSKLSWQVHKFATTPRPMNVTSHLPKPAAMKRFCEAAKKRAVPPTLITQVMRSVEAFGRLVDEHAGDRATFDAMVGNLCGDSAASQLALGHRRDAFRAQSHIWGVQAKAMISLMIFRDGSKPGTTDGITAGGRVHLRRFRHDAHWILAARCVASDKRIIGPGGSQALFPDDLERFGAPLLGKYCDANAESFRVVQSDAGVRFIEATAGLIGNNSAVTYMSGEIWRDVQNTSTPDGTNWLLARAMVRVPVEVLYHDVLVHRDMHVKRPPEVHHFSDIGHGNETLWHEDYDRLPLYDSVTYLGRGAECVFAPEYPLYPELVHDVVTSVNWDPSEFEVYRCRVAYPVLPSTLTMRFRATD